MKQPLYALIFVEGFGSEPLRLASYEHFNSKGNCEVKLERILNDARTHAGLPAEGMRFGGACVLMEDSSG